MRKSRYVPAVFSSLAVTHQNPVMISLALDLEPSTLEGLAAHGDKQPHFLTFSPLNLPPRTTVILQQIAGANPHFGCLVPIPRRQICPRGP